MMEPAGDACCGATARALDMFNRRGSVIAVVIGGNTPEVVSSCTASSSSIIPSDHPSSASDMEALGSIDSQSDWRPPYPRLIAFHDCLSLASAWSLGLNPSLLDDRPTGASQAQSPCEDDSGDGKSNEMLASCPAFSVAVSRSKEVPAFGPPLPKGATFSKCADFHDWLLTKIINAENAVHRSKKFATMAARTRREALRDLAENYVGTHQNEGPSRIASRFLGGSVKRRERQNPKPFPANIRGALSWLVDVHDHSINQRVSCVLGLSQDALVLLERPSGTAIFSTPTHSIIGWANTDMGLKIYYDHGDMLLLRCCTETGTDTELNLLLQRLKAVTKGDEAKEVVLRRARTSDSWGFHVQDEGVVTDVEMYQTAWKASLRQGSRIVEIESFTVATLSFDRISEILSERDAVRLLLISPANDGSPRRGCEDPHCPAVKGAEQMLTPDAFARQPISYQEMFRMRNREYGTSPANSPAGSLEDRSFTFSNMKRADGGRANSTCTASSYGQGPALTSINRQTSSVHDHMCLMLNTPKTLIRAQSDEHLRSPIAEENKK
ncbi:Rap-GAP domain-containing protein, partial [Trichostrongylus colubriformis]